MRKISKVLYTILRADKEIPKRKGVITLIIEKGKSRGCLVIQKR